MLVLLAALFAAAVWSPIADAQDDRAASRPWSRSTTSMPCASGSRSNRDR